MVAPKAQGKGITASGFLATWMELTTAIAAAFRMTDAEAKRLSGSTTARIIGAIPFIAGCVDPERTALAHLATYVMASKDGFARFQFDHKAADDLDVYARLRSIAGFEGGDEGVIAHGMALLALNMVQGYRTDIEKDRASGEYNALVSGAWDFEATRASLMDTLADNPAPELAELAGDLEALSFWF